MTCKDLNLDNPLYRLRQAPSENSQGITQIKYKMWQEARKQEKKLRGIMIDFKKRAERRQAYYAKMKMDPHQLMRIYGQKCKLHILGDNSKVTDTDGQLVRWQGDPEVLIDRFDARSHLDFIPDTKNPVEENEEEERLERKCNYESYRTLVQIDATGASEEQYLKQLAIEESYGRKQAEINAQQKLKSKANAKIHYKYNDSTNPSDEKSDDESDNDDDESDSDLSDIDINVNVIDLTEDQKNHLDALSTQYGIGYGQYCKQLLLEKKEFEYVKRLEEEEEERSKMPGRRGKAARRTLRLKQKTSRGLPLSFALQEKDGENDDDRDDDETSSGSDHSRSRSPNEGKIEFITEFGGGGNVKEDKHKLVESVDSRHNVKSKSHHSKSKSRHYKSGSRSRSRDRKRSRDRSRSRDRHSKRRSRSCSRSREKSRRDRHRPRSNSRSRSKRSKRSRSGSVSPKRRDSKSTKRSRSRSSSRSRSRDRSTSNRRRSGSRSRSKEKRRSKSPHGSITKMLGTNKPKESPATVDKSKLSAREKMKLRMQKMLNKQIKQDKKVEQKKQEAKEIEAEERDQEIYTMSKMLKTRDRDKRLRRSPSPHGRLPSYDASSFRYHKSRSRSPVS